MPNKTTTPPLPDVTEAQRHAAFEAMHWAGWAYEQAMAHDIRRRIIEARASQMRNKATRQQQQQQRRTWRQCWADINLPAHTATRPGFDFKRAAAGDMND